MAYRDNSRLMNKANSDLGRLKDLVVQSGASKGLLGSLGGIQAFATWGIILALIFGFGLMAVVIFSMWKNQTKLASAELNYNRKILSEVSGKEDGAAETMTPEKDGPPLLAENIENEYIRSKKPSRPLIIKIILSLLAFAFIGLAIFLALKFLPANKTIITKQPATAGEKNAPPPAPLSEVKSQASADYEFNNQENTADKKEVFENKETEQTIKIFGTPNGYLNVRETDSLESEIIGKVNDGETYQYLKERNGWYLVTLPDKKTGWVSGLYVRKINQ